jgi:hypothetical protein
MALQLNHSRKQQRSIDAACNLNQHPVKGSRRPKYLAHCEVMVSHELK